MAPTTVTEKGFRPVFDAGCELRLSAKLIDKCNYYKLDQCGSFFRGHTRHLAAQKHTKDYILKGASQSFMAFSCPAGVICKPHLHFVQSTFSSSTSSIQDS